MPPRKTCEGPSIVLLRAAVRIVSSHEAVCEAFACGMVMQGLQQNGSTAFVWCE